MIFRTSLFGGICIRTVPWRAIFAPHGVERILGASPRKVIPPGNGYISQRKGKFGKSSTQTKRLGGWGYGLVPRRVTQILGGGWRNIFVFSPRNLGRWTHVDSYFSKGGWFNHQLETLSCLSSRFLLLNISGALNRREGIHKEDLLMDFPGYAHGGRVSRRKRWWIFLILRYWGFWWFNKATQLGFRYLRG